MTPGAILTIECAADAAPIDYAHLWRIDHTASLPITMFLIDAELIGTVSRWPHTIRTFRFRVVRVVEAGQAWAVGRGAA